MSEGIKTMEVNQKQNNEKKTFIAIILTVITMAAEIIFGYFTHSMALLADGFHMGAHAFALSKKDYQSFFSAESPSGLLEF